MDSSDFEALSDAPYRLPSRHPAAGRGMRRLREDDEDLAPDTPSAPAATAPDAGSQIKRRQEALLLSYLINRPGRR